MSNNPFALAPQQTGALANTDQQRAIAEVQAAMLIARANPRDQRAAMDRILTAFQRVSLAEQGLYQYARGGSDISGLSIRSAEAIAQQWGNLQFGVRELHQTASESTVQAYAWDVETNTRREMTFQVQHVRHTRAGSNALSDPRDIYENMANQAARRLRACILAVVPADVQDAAKAQCEETLKARADTSPEAIKKMLERFAEFGISREQLEARIQRRLESITPAQILSLRKIYTSIKDGMSSPADWFEVATKAASTPDIDALNESLSRNAAPGAARTDYDEDLPDFQEPRKQVAEAKPAPQWPKERDGDLVDAAGIPWHADFHSGTKSCTSDGRWRMRRGYDQQAWVQWTERLQARAQHSASGGSEQKELAEPDGEPDQFELDMRALLNEIGTVDEMDAWLDANRTQYDDAQWAIVVQLAADRMRALGAYSG